MLESADFNTKKAIYRRGGSWTDNRIGQHIVERAAVAFDGEEHDEVDKGYKQRNQVSTRVTYCQRYNSYHNTNSKRPNNFAD